MNNTNYAVFVDLENTGGKTETFNSVIETVKIKGDILLGRAYGYSDRFTQLKESLLSNTFYVTPSIKFGNCQKNNMDIQLVIDALETAYTNSLIDCYCIVSGDSDYTPLVAKLKSMGKFVLGISRSAVASKVFISACSEFIFLEAVSQTKPKKVLRIDEPENTLEALIPVVEKILSEHADPDGVLHASELKKTLTRLRPEFDERNYGVSSFGKLLQAIKKKGAAIELHTHDSALKVCLASEDENTGRYNQVTKENYIAVFKQELDTFKANGFDSVNPSIIKASVQKAYPDFDERNLGFKRFSDLMRQLERSSIIKIELSEAGTMLVSIL
ncbi:MAG: NYN domain-containing protein [Bacillota bacterium]